MKSTYSAPAATTCGDVVGSTLGQKASGGTETSSPPKQFSAGSSLSFGL